MKLSQQFSQGGGKGDEGQSRCVLLDQVRVGGSKFGMGDKECGQDGFGSMVVELSVVEPVVVVFVGRGVSVGVHGVESGGGVFGWC